MKPLAERIAGYAYRYWMRRGMTEWPTVRQACRALKRPGQPVRVSDIEAEEGDRFFIQGYNIEGWSYSDMEIVATIPAVDVAWEAYWSGVCPRPSEKLLLSGCFRR